MAWWSGLTERLRGLLRRGEVEWELDEEIRFHLEEETAKHLRAGLAPAEARRRALVAFGGVERTKERVREARGTRGLEDGMQDVRYALRGLRRNPGFAVPAVLALGLGVGASVAVFSVTERALVRPLPYPSPDELVVVWQRFREDPGVRRLVAAPDAAVLAREGPFRGVAFVERPSGVTLTGDGDPRRLRLARVGPSFFATLGVRPLLGRLPGADDVTPAGAADPGEDDEDAEDETTPRTPPVPVALSHDLWSLRFGGDPEAVGRRVELDGRSALVIGVLPADFRLVLPPDAGFAGSVDVWAPVPAPLAEFRRPDRFQDQDSDNTGAVIARVPPGVGLSPVRAELGALAARLRDEVPFHAAAGTILEVEPLHEDVTRQARPVLLALVGGVVFVLLASCLNVVNLLLARAGRRRAETALRTALGAGRGRLRRQAWTEVGVLSVLGGLVGTATAVVGEGALTGLAPPGIPGLGSGLDPRSLLAAPLITALAALLLALAHPLGRGAEGNPAGALRGGGGGPGGDGRSRRGLIVAEVALSLVLLVGAGLMLRTVVRLQAVDPGFRGDSVLAFDLGLSFRDGYRGPGDRGAFVRHLEERLESLEGVEAAGVVGGLPLGGATWTQPWLPDGREGAWGAAEADFRVVTSGYFTALGVPLRAGRTFTVEDDRQDRRVIVVDETMARRVAGRGEAALDRYIVLPVDGEAVRARIVGVVGDVRYEELTRPGRGTVYVPYRHEASREIGVVVRTAGPPMARVEAVRSAVRSLDPRLPVHAPRPLSDHLERARAPARFTLSVLGAFALLALVLAAVGVYGVIAFSVGRRRREIGIRMALGAEGGSVRGAVLREGMALTALGLLLGVPPAAGLSLAIRGLLFDVRPLDLPTWLGVVGVLAGVALCATWVPALRASRVDPSEALRSEG